MAGRYIDTKNPLESRASRRKTKTVRRPRGAPVKITHDNLDIPSEVSSEHNEPEPFSPELEEHKDLAPSGVGRDHVQVGMPALTFTRISISSELQRTPVTIADELADVKETPLPEALEAAVQTLKEKRAALTKASESLRDAANPQSAKISTRFLHKQVIQRPELKSALSGLLRDDRVKQNPELKDAVSTLLVEDCVTKNGQWSKQLRADIQQFRALYQREKSLLDKFNVDLLAALQKAAEEACHLLLGSPIIQKIGQAYAKTLVAVFTNLVKTPFDVRNKVYLEENVKAKYAVVFLKSVQDNFLALYREKDDIGDETFALNIMSQCLIRQLSPFIEKGLLTKNKSDTKAVGKNKKLTLDTFVVSVQQQSFIEKLKDYERKETEIKKTSALIAHERIADQLVAEANSLNTIFEAETKQLEQQYDIQYGKIVADIVALESADNQLEALYAQKETKRDELSAFYDAEKKQNRTIKAVPDFFPSLMKLKTNLDLSFNARQVNAKLQARWQCAQEKYKRKIHFAGVYLGDVDAAPKPLPEEFKGGARDAKAVRAEKIRLIKDLLKYLEKVLTDKNMENFWHHQATTFCCMWAYKVRVGEGPNRKFIKVPTGAGQIKELLRDDKVLNDLRNNNLSSHSAIDRLRDDDVIRIYKDLQTKVKNRLEKGQGRNINTTGVFLNGLKSILFGNAKENTVGFDLNKLSIQEMNQAILQFKKQMFDMTDKANNRLDLSHTPTHSRNPSDEVDEHATERTRLLRPSVV